MVVKALRREKNAKKLAIADFFHKISAANTNLHFRTIASQFSRITANLYQVFLHIITLLVHYFFLSIGIFLLPTLLPWQRSLCLYLCVRTKIFGTIVL